MGTLGAQPVRNRDTELRWVDEATADMAALAKKHKVSAESVALLRISLALSDIRSTMVEDGDYRDEQANDITREFVTTFCQVMERTNEALEEIGRAGGPKVKVIRSLKGSAA